MIPRKAEPQIILLAEEAMLEMAPLEAGYFLRDLDINFPVTIDALNHARSNMGLTSRVITDESAMIEIGTCPKPAGAGFTAKQVKEAKKLEIVECMKHTSRPFRMYCLRGDLNKLLYQTRVEGQNA